MSSSNDAQPGVRQDKAKKTNMLTVNQMFKVGPVLLDMKEYIEKQRPTGPQLCQAVGEKVGFLVTPGNLRTLTEAQGIVWRPRKIRRAGSGDRPSYRAELAQLVRRVTELEAAVRGLQADLGIKPTSVPSGLVSTKETR